MQYQPNIVGAAAIAALALAANPAWASLSTFQTFSGAGVAASTDGCGSTTQTCAMTINVPTNATVLGAYLYSSLFDAQTSPNGTQLNATAINNFTPLGVNVGILQAWRSDVTDLVRLAVGGGGGPTGFTINEVSQFQDGEGLVVVYSDPAVAATQTVGILDGFSASTGDTATIHFAQPLDPSQPGFLADMRLGIGYSFDGQGCTDSGQVSQVTVNGTRISNNAGCNDDSQDVTPANGNLITVGGDSDPYSPFLPATQDDHERYDISGQINTGDTSITVDTLNPSNDDNIFLEVFQLTGEGRIITAPEPASLALLGSGLLAFGWLNRRRRTRS